MLYLLPQNSIVAYAYLLNVTNCKVIIALSLEPLVVTIILSVYSLCKIKALSVNKLLLKRYTYYIYKKNY